MSTVSGGISGGAAALTKMESAADGASFMSGMQEIQGKMQQDMVDKAELDRQNNKMNGIADSASKAGSAAAQVKIQY